MKLDKSSYVGGSVAVEVPNGEGKLTLYAHELGYLEVVKAYSKITSGEENGIAMLVAASVADKDGNKFTLDEVIKLKKSVAEPLFDAVLKINTLAGTEKN